MNGAHARTHGIQLRVGETLLPTPSTLSHSPPAFSTPRIAAAVFGPMVERLMYS